MPHRWDTGRHQARRTGGYAGQRACGLHQPSCSVVFGLVIPRRSTDFAFIGSKSGTRWSYSSSFPIPILQPQYGQLPSKLWNDDTQPYRISDGTERLAKHHRGGLDALLKLGPIGGSHQTEDGWKLIVWLRLRPCAEPEPQFGARFRWLHTVGASRSGPTLTKGISTRTAPLKPAPPTSAAGSPGR